MSRLFLCIGFLLLFSTFSLAQDTLAFPGAEGYGRLACANQPAKSVYYVTNLNNSGPGSLRAALSQGNRYVLFKVAGTITLSSVINVTNDNIYLAGQTAFKNGGEGITLRSDGNHGGGLISVSGDHFVIRYIRLRRGAGVAGEVSGDCINFFGDHWMMDHCSVSWSTDENIGASNSRYGTMQYSVSSEGLYFSTHAYSTIASNNAYQTGHSKGGLWGYSGNPSHNVSIYRNLFAHNDGRNPQIASPGSSHEVVNNLLYNNRYFNIAIDDLSSSGNTDGMSTNIVKNLLIPGSDTRVSRHMVHAAGVATNQIFMQGNIGVHRTNDTQSEWIEVGTYGTPSGQDGRSFTPFSTPLQSKYASLPNAAGLEQIVLADVGANLAPDLVDQRIFNDVMNRTPTSAKTVQGTNSNDWYGQSTYYGIINDPSEVGGWPTIAPMSSACVDTDDDGMPDNWETAIGLDPNDASDGLAYYGTNYPNIEIYLSDITGNITPTITIPGNPPTTPCTPSIAQDTIAFPGAVGYGRYAGVGQPARTVYAVTNLNNSGPGSLRDALSQGNRFVIFKVAGTITLSSRIDIVEDNIYIAGQTAFENGGQGITIRANGNYNIGLIAAKGDHFICRYIRFRRGPGGAGEVSGDNISLEGNHWILDHCSISWGTDENMDAFNCTYGTMQYCISSEGLYFSTHAYSTNTSHNNYQTGHSKGGLFGYSGNPANYTSFYRNLFAHNDGRNPKIGSPGSSHEVVNNLLYNNRYFNIELDEINGSMQTNVVKNLLIPGSDTRQVRHMIHHDGAAVNKVYVQGNIGVHRTDDSQPEWTDIGAYGTPAGQAGRSLTPFPTPMQPNYSSLPDAASLEQIVLADVGANLSPDPVDQRVINDVINRTPTTAKTVPGIDPNAWSGQATYYGIINDPSEVGGWPTLTPMSSPPADADNDGIPNAWESANGLNPNNPNDALADHASGYTNMEVYLSDLTGTTVAASPVLTLALDICLEGPQTANATMDNNLQQKNLLPAGQPYDLAPWSYQGTEGDGWTTGDYPPSSVDWVLVSLRESPDAQTEVSKVAAVVLQDGSIAASVCLPDNLQASYYVVVEHRNHLPAMTPIPIDIVNNTLTYDFRAADSYAVGSGFGQTPVGSNWCLFSCNADQSTPSGYEVTGQDNILWQALNGSFNSYESVDFNLDGDVNAQDKLLWSINNGVFSAVPK